MPWGDPIDNNTPSPSVVPKGHWGDPVDIGSVPQGLTEMHAGHPWVDAAEQAGEMGAFAGGALLGGPVGAGVAATGDQVLNALVNHYLSGRKIDLSPSNLEKATMGNVAGSYAGEVAAPAISKGAAKVFGTEALGKAAQEEATKGASAQADFDYARSQANQDANKQIGQLSEKVTAQLRPQARQAQISSDIGRTPEQTQATLAGNLERTAKGTLPGPAMVQRQQDFWHSVYDPIHKMSEAGGDQYNKFWAPHLNDPVDPAPMTNMAAEERAYAETNGITFSAPINKLLSRAEELGKGGALPNIEVLGVNLRDAENSNPEQVRDMAKRLGLLKDAGVTVQELRGLRSDASSLVASASTGRDKAAAQNVVDAVDKTLDTSGVLNSKEQAQLQALNHKWRAYKTIFDRSLLRKLSSGDEPVDVAGDIFDNPKRSSLLIANADKDQLSTLRRTYADWVNRDGAKVIKPEHQVALAKLFPGTPLSNPKSWLYADAKLTKFQDVVNSSPEMRQRFTQEYTDQLHDIQTKNANQIVAAAEKQAKQMGNFGENLIKQIRNAPDPISAANIATRGMTGLDTQAALQSIREGNMGKGGSMDFILRRWPLYAAFSVGTALAGKTPSPYIGGMAILGGAMAGVGAIRSGYLKYLAENPEATKAFWDAVSNPGTPAGFRKMAQLAVKAGIADATAGVAKQEAGVSLESKDEGTGDGVKALEKSHSEHLAPTPSASKKALDVSRDVVKGKTPDVSHDLNRGRLSLDETNKLIQQASNTDPAAMVQGIPLSEMMDAVEQSSPDERKMLMPLVEQRLRKELPQEKNKTLQMKLAQRFQRLQTMPAQEAEA